MSEKRAHASALRRVLNDTARTKHATRAQQGFTMMELLAVIAIIAIISAVAFVSITQIQKDMQQKELDTTAQELFVVAQNHLSSSDAQGFISRLTPAEKGMEEVVGHPADQAAEPGVYYFAVNGPTTQLYNNDRNVLAQMLPEGSIDDTVRRGGTYLVKYNLETSTVLDVFFAHTSQTTLFGASAGNFYFTEGDYARLFGNNPSYTGAGNKNRQSYPTSNGNIIIGWYGDADAAALAGEKLKAPMLRVENAERLTAIVTTDITNAQMTDLAPTLNLIVKGATSGKTAVITLFKDGSPTSTSSGSYVQPIGASGAEYRVYLDDITFAPSNAEGEGGGVVGSKDGRFVNILGDDGFIPGEDLKIQATLFSTSKLTNVAKSAQLRRNSLFASISPTSSSDDARYTVRISNVRHLENLAPNVSGFNPNKLVSASNVGLVAQSGGITAVRAVQTKDLSWTDFQNAIRQNGRDGKAAASDQEVRVYEYTNTETPVDFNSFFPITVTDYVLNYDGAAHRISDVYVQRDSGKAGLFGELSEGTVSGLELVNFRITTKNGDAGALAGMFSNGTKATNVVAYNDVADDSSYEIRGTASVGGLVGALQYNKVQNSADGPAGTLDLCAASVYVRSTNEAAGGLVGWTSGEAFITRCYAGGHTVSGGMYGTSVSEGVPGRINVIAGGNAGGISGVTRDGSLTIEKCYSTASVRGGSDAGGIAGWISNGSVEHCYSTGAVSSSEGVGPIFGAPGGASSEDNSYIAFANYDKKLNVSDEPARIDASYATFAAFAQGRAPYHENEPALAGLYPDGYPFPTLAAWAGVDDTSNLLAFVTEHYGDWPAVDAAVVNL